MSPKPLKHKTCCYCGRTAAEGGQLRRVETGMGKPKKQACQKCRKKIIGG